MKIGLGYSLLFLTWGLIAVDWFFPGGLKIAGALLYALGEAAENIRSVFHRRFREHRGKGLHVEAVKPDDAPIHNDLVRALVSQGASRKQVVSAVVQLPRDVSFQRGFQIATAAMREAAA